MSYCTTVYGVKSSAFGVQSHNDHSYVTSERTFWEVSKDNRLDVLVGDLELVATHLPGTWYAVSVAEASNPNGSPAEDVYESDFEGGA